MFISFMIHAIRKEVNVREEVIGHSYRKNASNLPRM